MILKHFFFKQKWQEKKSLELKKKKRNCSNCFIPWSFHLKSCDSSVDENTDWYTLSLMMKNAFYITFSNLLSNAFNSVVNNNHRLKIIQWKFQIKIQAMNLLMHHGTNLTKKIT